MATGTIEAITDVLDNVGMDFGALIYDTDDSSSSTSSSDLGCTSPTWSTIGGLPAISSGTDFDGNLDDALEYYSVATESEVPNLLYYQMECCFIMLTRSQATLLTLAPGSSTTTISRVMRRSFWSKLNAAVKTVASVVKTVAKTVATKVATVAKTVVSTAISAVKTVVKTVASTVVTIAKTAVYCDWQLQSNVQHLAKHHPVFVSFDYISLVKGLQVLHVDP
jgi:hypothetical protein